MALHLNPMPIGSSSAATHHHRTYMNVLYDCHRHMRCLNPTSQVASMSRSPHTKPSHYPLASVLCLLVCEIWEGGVDKPCLSCHPHSKPHLPKRMEDGNVHMLFPITTTSHDVTPFLPKLPPLGPRPRPSTAAVTPSLFPNCCSRFCSAWFRLGF